MSVELPTEDLSNNPELLITSEVSFKPFENESEFHVLDGSDYELPHAIAENYQHTLVMRRHVNFQRMHGHIDVITECPAAPIQLMLPPHNPSKRIEKPFGPTIFFGTMDNRSLHLQQEPCVLRFSFNLQNPSDLTRLLQTYGTVDLGEEKYRLLWNLQRKKRKRLFNILEIGKRKEVKITEKNLFNVKWMNELEEEFEGEEETVLPNEDIGRVTFIWLPMDIERLKTIQITFHGDNNSDGVETPIPKEPESINVPVFS